MAPTDSGRDADGAHRPPLVRPMNAAETVTWSEVETLCEALARDLSAHTFDAVLAVARGGLVPAAVLAEILDIRSVLVAAAAGYEDRHRSEHLHFLEFPPDQALNGRRILVVDDIWDSGRTGTAVRHRVSLAGGRPWVAVLHYKPDRDASPAGPDLAAAETDAWVVYPWETVAER